MHIHYVLCIISLLGFKMIESVLVVNFYLFIYLDKIVFYISHLSVIVVT